MECFNSPRSELVQLCLSNADCLLHGVLGVGPLRGYWAACATESRTMVSILYGRGSCVLRLRRRVPMGSKPYKRLYRTQLNICGSGTDHVAGELPIAADDRREVEFEARRSQLNGPVRRI